MALNKPRISLIANTAADGNEGVSNEHVLTYVSANNRVEFKALTLTVSGVDTVSANVTAENTRLSANIDTVQDNIATNITSLGTSNTNIDTIQSNLDTYATYANSTFTTQGANSFSNIAVGSSNVLAESVSANLFLLAGNGISFSANSDAQSITFTAGSANIASDYYVLDGTANTVTLTQSGYPANALYVTIGGLVQEQGIDYSVSGTTLTVNNSYPIINGTDLEVKYLPYTGELFTSGGGSSPTPYWSGSSYGYELNGPGDTSIQKYPFSSDTSSSDVGELTQDGWWWASFNSQTHGYASWTAPVFDKFPFSSDTPSSSIGSSTGGFRFGGSQSSTDGYFHGGYGAADAQTTYKYPLSSDTAGASVFQQPLNVGYGGISCSETAAYETGGAAPGASPDCADYILKFLFSSDTGQQDVAELAALRQMGVGNSSPTHGYMAGGIGPSPGYYTDTIQKFPFSSDSPASDIGELLTNLGSLAGQGSSSTTHGYVAGGTSGPTHQDTIQKYPFSSDTSSSDVGELSDAGGYFTAFGHNHA